MRERGGKIPLVPDTEGMLDRAIRRGASSVCAAGDEGGVIGEQGPPLTLMGPRRCCRETAGGLDMASVYFLRERDG